MDIIITWGKYAGRPVSDLPRSYCAWLVENLDLSDEPDLEEAVRDRLDTLSFGKYIGRSIDEVPATYLTWLIKNVKIDPELEERILKRLGATDWQILEFKVNRMFARPPT